MLPSIGLFNRHLRNITRSSQYKIRMLNSIFSTVGHANDEWSEWRRVKEFSNPCFHAMNI